MKLDINNIKVDRANMCIDRNTPLGKQFADFTAALEKETDPDKKAFMGQMAAYAEAALVIDTVYPGPMGKTKLHKLAKQMES